MIHVSFHTPEQGQVLLDLVRESQKTGRPIQFRNGPGDEWVDKREGDTSYGTGSEYRLKPEPTYRPFESGKELAEALQKQSSCEFRPSVYRKYGSRQYYIHYSCTYVDLHARYDYSQMGEDSPNRTVSFQTLLEDFQFHNGSPCGVLEE